MTWKGGVVDGSGNHKIFKDTMETEEINGDKHVRIKVETALQSPENINDVTFTDEDGVKYVMHVRGVDKLGVVMGLEATEIV